MEESDGDILYRGRRLGDMTHEEIIHAFADLARLYTNVLRRRRDRMVYPYYGKCSCGAAVEYDASSRTVYCPECLPIAGGG